MRLPDTAPRPPALNGREHNTDLSSWANRWLHDYLLQWFTKVIAVLNGGLTFGDGFDAGNHKGVWVLVADTGTAEAEFLVTHNIGKKPVQFFHTIDKPGVLYKSNESLWNGETIRLKCSIDNAEVRVFVCAPE